MSDDFEGDAFGRLSEARSSRLLYGVEVAREAEGQWTPDEVRRRLEEATRWNERLERRPGPSQKITAWIDWRLHKNLSDFDRNAQAAGIREKTRAPDRSRLVLTGAELARMDEALQWLGYLADDRYANERKALQIFMWCAAKNQSWSQFFRIAAPHRSTANRRRDRALEIIANCLAADGVVP